MPRVRAYLATGTDGLGEQGSASPSRRRGRRRGVEIRPGSVKQARLEAGLSLGQVALGDISRTAIYFVETGKAKPSMETLHLIATRTNKPVDFFLGAGDGVNEEAALIEIERLVAVGDNAAAATAADALIAKTSNPTEAAHARVLAATALIRLGQPVRARSQASAARAHFEQAGDVLMTAESLSWEAAGAMQMQDPAALGYAHEALERCRSLRPVPVTTEAKLLAILGHVHNARHEYAKAIDAYEQAASVGAAFPDLRRLSYVYGNLSLAYQETGQYARAAHYAHRALTIHETLQDTLSIGVSENNLALLMYKQGDLAGAFRHAESALRRYEALGVEAGRSHVLMTLTELELARSDYAAATRHATAAVAMAERLGETANVGEAHVWLGRVAAAQGDDDATDAQFAAALGKFESADATDWLARGHALYADLLEARGDLVAANRHLRRALAALGMRGTPVQDARTAIA